MEKLPREGLVIQPHLFTTGECQSLAATLLDSRLRQENRLSGAFDGSSGLQLVFTRDGVDELQSGFPFLYPVFKAVALPESNAFFMNTLVIQDTFRIKPHLDCSLDTFVNDHITPTRVSVLYVQVPEDLKGGELELFDASGEVTIITPSQALLVQFQGDLVHGLREGHSKGERISLVLEEYDLEETILARVPHFSLKPRLERRPANVEHPGAYQKVQDLVHSLSEEERAQLLALLATK